MRFELNNPFCLSVCADLFNQYQDGSVRCTLRMEDVKRILNFLIYLKILNTRNIENVCVKDFLWCGLHKVRT